MSTMSNFRSLFIVAAAILAPVGCASDSTTDTPVNLPDIENGKATFKTICSGCHSAQEIGGSILGPNLIGVVGRAAASQPEFTEYSPALQASRLTWSVETLDTFLASPMAMVPNTFMPIVLKDDKTRADVIAYLATLEQ